MSDLLHYFRQDIENGMTVVREDTFNSPEITSNVQEHP